MYATSPKSLHFKIIGSFSTEIPWFQKLRKCNLPSLKLTAKAPENRLKPNRKGLYSNHPFSGRQLIGSISSQAWLEASGLKSRGRWDVRNPRENRFSHGKPLKKMGIVT